MDLTTLFDVLEPHIVRLIQSNKITVAADSGGTGAMELHSLYGPYHTGQLDESQALWVGTKITARIADHAAEADVHHPRLHGMLDTSHHFIAGGSALDLFGQSAPATLARISPSSDPGATAAVLKTASDGGLKLAYLTTATLTSDTSLGIVPIGDLTLNPFGGDTFVIGSFKVTGSANVTVNLDVDGTVFGNVAVETPTLKAAANLLISANGGMIDLDSSGDTIRILDTNDLRTDNYTSQLSGWRITYGGEADFRYIYAEQMKVKTFIADLSMALAGSEIITKSVATLADDFRVPMPGQAVYAYFDDLPSAENMAAFESGDKIRFREFSRAGGGLSVTDCWGNVTSYTDQADKLQRWTFTRDGTNDNATIAASGARQIASSNGTSVVVTKVAGTIPHDSMFALIITDRIATVTPPSGWTMFTYSDVSGSRVSLYKKIAVVGDLSASNYTFSFASSGNNLAALVAYHGVAELAVWTTRFDLVNALSTTIPFPDTWSASTQGDMMLTMVGIVGDYRVTPNASLTELYDGGAGGLSAFVADRKMTTRGATGEMPSTFTDGSAHPYIAINIGMLPTHTLDATTGYAVPGTVMETEQPILDYGVSGNGYIEMTTVDGVYGSNSPYMRVVTWTGHPATGSVVRTLNGHMRGIFGVANEFGFFAGSGVTDNDSYMRMSPTAYRLNNVPIRLYTSGTQKVNIDAGGVDIWVGPSSADKRLTWDGTTLGVKGAITVTAASSIAGSGYIQIGSGTVNTTLNGWYMSPTNIVGQAGGVTQTELTNTGKIAAGGGLAYLDANGISIIGQTTDNTVSHSSPRAVSFYTGSFSTLIGRVTGYYYSGSYGMQVYVRSPDVEVANVIIAAQQAGIIYSGSNAGEPRLVLTADAFSTGAYATIYADTAIRLFVTSSASPDFMVDNDGIILYRSVTVGSTVPRPALDGVVSIGSTARNYTPSSGGDWSSESTLLLTGQDYSTIGFHDSLSRVDYIRVGGGVMTLGYNAGWGAARIDIPGILGTTWTGLSFGSGWTDYGVGWLGCAWKKVGDLVILRGLAKRTSGVGTTIGTLPAGSRPSGTHMITTNTDTGAGRVDIDTAGVITLVVGSSGFTSLFNVVFSTI